MNHLHQNQNDKTQFATKVAIDTQGFFELLNENRIILKTGDFPPPLGGVATFNARFYDLLVNQNKYKYVFLNTGKWVDKENVVNVRLSMKKSIGDMLVHPILVVRAIKILIPIFRSEINIKMIFSVIARAIHLRTLLYGGSYTVLTDHLGKNQLPFYVLKRMGLDVEIYCYLHGGGIRVDYEANPSLYKRIALCSDGFLCSTKYMLNILKKKTGLDNAHIHPCFLPDSYREFSLEKENVILFVGNLNAGKKPDYLVDEFYKSIALNTGYKLWIIGQGELEGRVREKIKDSSVLMLGSMDSDAVSEFIGRAKYLVLPSVEETFGIVITEAMSKGTIPIVSKGDGKEEVFSELAGYKFDLSEGALSTIINKAISDEFYGRSKAAFDESSKYAASEAGMEMLDLLASPSEC